MRGVFGKLQLSQAWEDAALQAGDQAWHKLARCTESTMHLETLLAKRCSCKDAEYNMSLGTASSLRRAHFDAGLLLHGVVCLGVHESRGTLASGFDVTVQTPQTGHASSMNSVELLRIAEGVAHATAQSSGGGQEAARDDGGKVRHVPRGL